MLLLAACLVYSSAGAEAPVIENATATPPARITSAPGPIGPTLPTIIDPTQAEPLAPAVAAPQPVEPATPDTSFLTAIGKTADYAHDGLERGILREAIRLDNFFGAINSQKEQRTSYLLRWRSSMRADKGGKLRFGATLRANFNLSRISERAHLIISGEDEPDPLAPSLPEDPGTPGIDRTFQTTRVVNTELRYQMIHSPFTDCFLGAGVNLVWPLQPFARARYQHTFKLSEISLVRATETFFAKTPYGVGETSELGLEHLLAPKTVLRWANSGTVSQEIGALEWGSELSLLHELSSRSAVIATGGIYGNTSFSHWVSNYRILSRYRRNFLRSWLYYELEPELTWPRSADGRFPLAYAVTFRLEVVFQGREVKKVAGL